MRRRRSANTASSYNNNAYGNAYGVAILSNKQQRKKQSQNNVAIVKN